MMNILFVLPFAEVLFMVVVLTMECCKGVRWGTAPKHGLERVK